MSRLAGKVAVVTGAARLRGIGRAIALRLAEEGADIVVNGRRVRPDRFPEHEREAGWRGIESVAAEVEALGSRCVAIDGDVTVQADADRLAEVAMQTYGRLDILVNNAALPSDAGAASILDMDDDVWLRTVDVNLNGVYRVTRACGRIMRDVGHGGSIINISSMAGRVGLPNYGAYCATKFAVIGMTQQLALELVRFGIRVNCVCPGSTDTDMMDGTIGRTAGRFHSDTDSVRKQIRAQIPMGRQGEVEEQAAAVAFLASPDASYITGQTLNVDGGLRFD
ncbi:MAG: 3-oxoacyl-ACP reductase FabG [Gammaproteobacteria bacterium]|nr:3-oxoacyl-ACP reductase FabG [Gammaproteobacteria bacterium]